MDTRKQIFLALLLVLAPSLAAEEGAESSQPDSLTVGAYYYPWYEAAESGQRGWMSKAMRGRLQPRQLPKLGVYDSNDSKVIGEHIAQSVRAGLDFWAVSWWGPGRREDRTFREQILTQLMLRNSSMPSYTNPPAAWDP